jgi:phosphoglycerate dehydrogenase-like enzyme
MTRVAILDDWQGIAQASADWSQLASRAELVFFQEPAGTLEEAAARLAGFDILMAMRERQPFPAPLVARLPRLRMIALTGRRAGSMDMAALAAHGVVVSGTAGGDTGASTAELALGLLLAGFRHIATGDASIRNGGFQHGVPLGITAEGRTLGVIGLGRIGSRVARAARALDMRVLAWSPNLTEAAARDAGAERVGKAELLEASDAVTLHLVLSERSRGIVGADDLARMKPGALLVNTARGPLVDEAALLAALNDGHVRAALDVYALEPLPADHPLRVAPNTVLTPHLGYVVEEMMPNFYRESIANILAFLDGQPTNVVNRPVAKAASG